MQMVKRTVGGFLLLVLFLWILAPKEEIYYWMEHKLAKEGIVISNEQIKDTFWGLEISDADIYLKGIKVAEIGLVKLNLFFLYNQLSIQSVLTDKGIGSFAPKSIDALEATFSILKPYKVAIEGSGSFGTISGGLYWTNRKLLLRFSNVKDIRPFKKFLKKDKKGLYYEKKY